MKLLDKLLEFPITNPGPSDSIGEYLISQKFKYCRDDSSTSMAYYVRRSDDPYEEMHEVVKVHYFNNVKPTLELHEVHTHKTRDDEDPIHLLKMHLEKVK